MKNEVLIKEVNKVLANINDDGRNGKAIEGLKKALEIGYIRGEKLVTSNQKDYDFMKGGIKYEIKTRCGELDTLINHYERGHNVMVWYSPTAEINDFYLLTVKDFIEGLNSLGLIRTKRKTSGKECKAIQTFYTSKKRTKALYEMLERYSL